MRLPLQVLLSRLRATRVLVLLRLLGLSLAAVLTAAVPAFVAASMQQVLVHQVEASPDSLSLVVNWTATDLEDRGADIDRLEEYLQTSFLSGMNGSLKLVTLQAGGQRLVQLQNADGKPNPGKRYLELGMLPPAAADSAAPFTLVSGRLPAPGAPEVVLLDTVLAKQGFAPGDQLRVPLTANTSGAAVTVTVVGTIQVGDGSDWAGLLGALDTTMLTSSAYFESLAIPAADVTWAIRLPREGMRTAGLPYIAAQLNELPLRVARFLPGASVVMTPVTWVNGFLGQMQTTERLLLVLMLPIFLLVMAFALVTADLTVRSRTTEVAVLRSRGRTPLGVIRFYLGESLLLVGAAMLLGFLLTGPIVQLLGLSAGFLKLVDRPLLPVSPSLRILADAALGALLVELISLLPLIPTTSLTVANLSRESVTRSPGGSLLRAVTELLLLAVLVYETVQLLAAGSISSTLFLALPALFLVGVGLVVWRGVELVAYLADRMAGDRLSPAGYLVLSLLRHRSGRYRMLWLMLVVTMGLGIYGAKFARTLDTDLVATSQYHLGSDLRLRTYWEAEILKANASGKAQSVIYHEPPYSTYQNLPGAAATAKVQLRTGVSLFAGAKLLGNVDFQGIDPQEFGRTALFLPGLPPSPEADLKAMAADESAVLVAQSLADRLGIKPGDTLTAKTDLGEASFTVARIVANWPGRLPGDGEFVVASLSYLQNNLGLEPYDVWVRLKPGADVTQLLQELHDRQALVVDLSGLAVTVADGRREPLRLGMYGMLSAGFVVAVLVMALSYLLNVGTILRSRTKELGVLRAMGMSQRQVAWSLYGEQLLLLGTATATGLAVGGWAGSLYVPVLRVQPGQQLLPIPAASAAAEQFVLLLGGLAVLGMGMQTVSVWMRRLAIGKALRLGEDG